MKIASWNVNGLRSIKTKGGLGACIEALTPDILCLQEIRCTMEQAQEVLKGYKSTFPYVYINPSTAKRGYSGTAIISKIKAESIQTSFDDIIPCCDEGRVQLADFGEFAVVNCYVPNSGTKRHELRTTDWDPGFATVIAGVNKPLIVVGDLNVAHEEIDVHSPKTCKSSAGFTPAERHNFKSFMLDHCKLVDSFRKIHGQKKKYSWWSNIGKCRLSDKGWRIDYVLTSSDVNVDDSDIACDVMGSDHAPVYATLTFASSSSES